MQTSNTDDALCESELWNDGSDSNAFSWWRDINHHALGYTVGNFSGVYGELFDAITDDFGNLVKAGK